MKTNLVKKFYVGNGNRDIQVESTRYCAAPHHNNTPNTRHPRPSSVGSRYTPTRDYSVRQRNSPKFRNRSPSVNLNQSLPLNPTRYYYNSSPNFADPAKASCSKAMDEPYEAISSVKNSPAIEEKVARLKAKEASRHFSLLPSLIKRTEAKTPIKNDDIDNIKQENKNDEIKIDKLLHNETQVDKIAQNLQDIKFTDITQSTSPFEMNPTRKENSGKLYLLF